jgi:hypothetical protein
METDGGGWTLFFSYVHHPYEDYDLNNQKMPIDPVNSKCHMNLSAEKAKQIAKKVIAIFLTIQRIVTSTLVSQSTQPVNENNIKLSLTHMKRVFRALKMAGNIIITNA